MGNKYIIEIEESYSRDGWPNEDTPDVLYRVKGFNSLVFDQRGLDKLENADEEYDRGFEQGYAYSKTENELPSYAYEKGLQDAWEAAKQVLKDYCEHFDNCMLNGDDDYVRRSEEQIIEKYRLGELKNVAIEQALFEKGPEYVIESLRLWKEKNEEIHVGDEVQIISAGTKGVVTLINGEFIEGMIDAICGFRWYKKDIQKTGRHFPQVAELLEKMKEGKDDAENS